MLFILEPCERPYRDEEDLMEKCRMICKDQCDNDPNLVFTEKIKDDDQFEEDMYIYNDETGEISKAKEFYRKMIEKLL